MTADTLLAVAPAVSYLEQTLGLSFSGLRRTRLVAAVEAQRAAARLSSDAFLAAVARRGPLFDRLVTEVTVGETYFFRDRRQCEFLRAVVLPEVAASAVAVAYHAVERRLRQRRGGRHPRGAGRRGKPRQALVPRRQ